MASFKVSLAIVAFMASAAMFCHVSLAQNSPDDYVNAHNEARAEVGVPPLKWNVTLEAHAADHANKRIDDCAMVHSTGHPYGENLLAGEGMTGEDAVNHWVGEKALYNATTNSCAHQNDCVHYTEVVWRGVTDVGCARVQCANGHEAFIVCNYWPMGNVPEQRPY